MMVCRALHKAAGEMREKCLSMTGGSREGKMIDDSDGEEAPVSRSQPELPAHWIPYVRFGVKRLEIGSPRAPCLSLGSL